MDIPRNFHIMLCVMFSISVYNDGHKRGQTSRHVIEVEVIQLYIHSVLLDDHIRILLKDF